MQNLYHQGACGYFFRCTETATVERGGDQERTKGGNLAMTF